MAYKQVIFAAGINHVTDTYGNIITPDTNLYFNNNNNYFNLGTLDEVIKRNAPHNYGRGSRVIGNDSQDYGSADTINTNIYFYDSHSQKGGRKSKKYKKGKSKRSKRRNKSRRR